MDAAVAWIVSPHASTRQLIGLNLNKRGLQVIEASTLDGLQRADARPDLVVVDVDPLDSPDWEIASSLRREPALKGVPLIVMSADRPTNSRLVSLYPARWISKPVDIQAFLNLVQEYLPEQRSKVAMNSTQKSLADRVRAIPGGEHLYMCYSCGTCVGSCMIQLTGERAYNPRRLIQKVINGLEQEAFEDRTTWLCSACDLCYPHCPQKIHVSDILAAVRALAIEAEYGNPFQVARVNERTCVGCGLCVELCPYEAISLVEKQVAGHAYSLASVDANRCMSCGLCTAGCRSASIELEGRFSNETVIDDLWQWIRSAPVPVPAEKVPAWAAVFDTAPEAD